LVYRSLFECTYPVHEGTPVFKTHPTIPELEASRCGYVRTVDSEHRIDAYSTKSLAAIVYECWSQSVLKPFTNIRYKNLNPYDLSYDNLEILVVDDPERIEKEKRFMENTVDQMLLREQMFGEYRDMEDYFKQLGIPTKYINMWKKKSPSYNPKLSRKQMV